MSFQQSTEMGIKVLNLRPDQENMIRVMIEVEKLSAVIDYIQEQNLRTQNEAENLSDPVIVKAINTEEEGAKIL